MLAMVVNEDAGCLTPRGVLGCIVGTPPGACSLLRRTKFARTLIRGHRGPVGASRLARVVNDDAGHLTPRGVLGCIASMLAPTENEICQDVDPWPPRTCRSEHARDGRQR